MCWLVFCAPHNTVNKLYAFWGLCHLKYLFGTLRLHAFHQFQFIQWFVSFFRDSISLAFVKFLTQQVSICSRNKHIIVARMMKKINCHTCQMTRTVNQRFQFLLIFRFIKMHHNLTFGMFDVVHQIAIAEHSPFFSVLFSRSLLYIRTCVRMLHIYMFNMKTQKSLTHNIRHTNHNTKLKNQTLNDFVYIV